ncbi:SUR7/PalI family-domain-containing protein [Mycena rosella]|uniref:SUR7/PalI family-domain-containing protein n=1 Tax=Mycena rosella TaxID=1033263 RepID=A0AAD7GEQ1_MYCRO|nr:SUR7/PalI family-domain-containing protein [Mycena rosella]
MARIFCIPGIIFLLCALVLSILVTISLPFLPALDFVRVHFGSGVATTGQGMTELRFGIWAPCTYDNEGTRSCLKASVAYLVSISNEAKTANVVIGSSWTRGLAVHPVATAVTFIAFLLSFSTHHMVTLAASLVSFLAALLTLIAFAIDIALFAFVHHEIKKLPDVNGKTTTSAAFWMTFVTFILLLLAGCTVCFGRRRDRMSGAAAYPMSSTSRPSFLSRFRRNKI